MTKSIKKFKEVRYAFLEPIQFKNKQKQLHIKTLHQKQLLQQ